jgi:uncharacterized protein YkwD
MVRSTVAGAIANALLITVGLLSIDTMQSRAYEPTTSVLMQTLTNFKKDLKSQQQPLSATAKSADTSLSEIEQDILAQINDYRSRQGLAPLQSNPTVYEQARQHSLAMANGRVPFSHDGFEERIRAISQQLAYGGAAENVAFNQGYGSPASQAVSGWLRSSGHRQNIEGQYNLTGIGVAQSADGGYYVTQIFVRTLSD